MNTRISAFIVFAVLSHSTLPASAALHILQGFCCNDGQGGSCAGGQAGAEAWARQVARAEQLIKHYPYADSIQIKGDQVGCSQGCSCPVSMLRHWNFEYWHLTLIEPLVEFRRTVQWSNCVLAP